MVDFLKKHYEKVLLSLVLLMLAVAAGGLPFMITQTQQTISNDTEPPRSGNPAPVEPVAVDEYRQRIGNLTMAVDLELTGQHNLLNPVQWSRTPDGEWVKETERGAQALEVARIFPLYTRVRLIDTIGSGGNPRYVLGIAMEAAQSPSRRREMNRYVRPGETSDSHPFVLTQVEGPADNPTALILKRTDNGEQGIRITDSASYQQHEGYGADLTYPPDPNRDMENLHQGDTFRFQNETYNIVAITENDVTVEAESGQRTTLEANTGQ